MLNCETRNRHRRKSLKAAELCDILSSKRELLTLAIFVHFYSAATLCNGVKVAAFSSLETGEVAKQKAHPSSHGGRGFCRVLLRPFRWERRRALLPVVRSQGGLLDPDTLQMALQGESLRARFLGYVRDRVRKPQAVVPKLVAAGRLPIAGGEKFQCDRHELRA